MDKHRLQNGRKIQGSKGLPIPTLRLYDHSLKTGLLMFYFCTIPMEMGHVLTTFQTPLDSGANFKKNK